jgi:peroxiredoxin
MNTDTKADSGGTGGERQREPYLRPRFSPSHYDLSAFPGPRAGESARDFTLYDLDGNPVKLSAYRGKWVVLETGSATCSMYTKNIPGIKQLQDEFPDVEFLVVYVREAHPGERLGQHKSFVDKQRAAALLKPRYGEYRQVLIDTLEGDMHRFYGLLPNIVYIINPDGVVHYRCNWATIDGIRKALGERNRVHTDENADMLKLWRERDTLNSLRTMWTGGFVALWDFAKAVPRLIKGHKVADRQYAERERHHS